MTLQTPACQTRLNELLTTPTTSVDHRIAEWVSHVPEPEARDFLLTVMDDDRGTRAADIAREIWHLAADTSQEQR